jgi:hypothetical protein
MRSQRPRCRTKLWDVSSLDLIGNKLLSIQMHIDAIEIFGFGLRIDCFS